jgi:hypothetical protein
VHLELRCDGDHGLLPPAPALFDQDCIVQQLSAAMRAGWKETFNAAGEKCWLGPCCSKKKVIE